MIKVGYPGDLGAFAEIVASAPVPVVVAGGPRTETIHDGLRFTAEAVKAGAVGAVVGRNIWGADDIEGVAAAYRAVIHDGATPDEALASVGGGEALTWTSSTWQESAAFQSMSSLCSSLPNRRQGPREGA